MNRFRQGVTGISGLGRVPGVPDSPEVCAILRLAVAMVWLIAISHLAAQGAAVPGGTAGGSAGPGVTAAEIRQAAAAWEASDLPEGTKRLLAAMAAEAQADLAAEEQARAEAAAFRTQIESLPAEIAALRESISRESDPADLPLTIPPDGNKGDILEVALAAGQEAVEKARQDQARVAGLQEAREVRRKELNAMPAAIAAGETGPAGAAPVASDAPPVVAQARTLAAAAARQSRSARLEAAQAELAYYDAEAGTGILPLREQAAEANLARLQKRQEYIRSQVDAARAEAAAAAVREAAANESTAPEELRGELAAVTRRADENRHLVEVLIPEANERLTRTEEEVARWTEISSRTRERIRRLGASGVVGVELRRQLQDLPAEPALRAAAEQRHEDLTSLETTRLALEEELADLPPEDGLEPEGSPLKARRSMLNELEKNYGRYFNLLVRLNEIAGQLEAVVRAQRAFAYEQILWMPSAPPAGYANLPAFQTSMQWLWNGLAGGILLREWMAGVQRAPWERAVLPLLPAIAFVLLRRRAGRRLTEEAVAASEPGAPFAATARAVLWTVLLVLPWPYVIWAAARPLFLSSDPFALAWGEGMSLTAMVLPGLEFLRQSLRPKGLADAHFFWNRQGLASLRGQMRRSVLLITPTVWIGGVFGHAISIRHDSAWRLCLLLLLSAMAWWLHQFWKTGRDAHQGRSGEDLRGAVWLGWWLGHAVSVAVPVVLAILALRGYLYTAEVLTGRLALSLLALAIFILLRELFFRWYGLHRARLRAARARRLREVRESTRSGPARESSANNPSAAGAGNDLAVEVAKDEFRGQDIDETGEQMRRLVGVISFPVIASVLWVIWADVMPAARRLSGPQSLPAVAAIPRDAPQSAAAPQTASPVALPSAPTAAAPARSVRREVGLIGIVLALAAAVITWMAARRIPGALQFALSSRISMDAGVRFALGTITRYLIIIAGTVFALKSVGLSWSNVQWLAAALTVGLGFGLQEIFANFFSGLIILFERPIRPGDVVTIDNITGTVARIQIRATTIRTADYTEYIVPNREFITGKLLNWTLTDTISRMTVQVGVAYQTDIPKALGILKKIADEHPDVRKEPAPSIACEGFQDSSVNLVLRYYLSSLDQRLSSLSDIHCRIAAEFSAAGIEIPFPRRDLHLLQPAAAEPVQDEEGN